LKFTKPALSVVDQIALLQQRGMEFFDEAAARHTLTHINYYRLRAYWLPFETVNTADPTALHAFVPGTQFEAALASYTFDQRLKLLLMDAVERVEIALRTRWAHELALRYGSHAYLDTAIFASTPRQARCLQSLQDEVVRSKETFLKHYRDTYADPALPPIWAVCEVLTLGQLSQWLDNLKLRSDRQAVAQALGFDEVVICAFAHHLATVRNLCAHHSRVWNRKLTIKMKIPTRPTAVAAWFNPTQDRKIYNTLLMLVLLLERISPDSSWKARLMQLMATMPLGTAQAMGFPDGWQTFPVWAPTMSLQPSPSGPTWFPCL
jgi:abortive infection bacteriophage resistance protein